MKLTFCSLFGRKAKSPIIKAGLVVVCSWVILHAVAPAKLSAQNVQEGKGAASKTEVPALHVFKIPQDCLHYCMDPIEAQRRWELTKEMTTADVYALGNADQNFILTPILKQAAVRRMGGGSKTELSEFGVDVTSSQRTKMDEAIQKHQLFILYYHSGW